MKNLKYVFIFLLSFVVLSCSKIIGYGVVNWSMPEYNLVAGDVLPVYVRSNVSKAYIVEIDNGEKKEIPLWQLTFFRSKADVDAFRHRIAENAFMYAEVLSDGLPMREAPENTSHQVYRLRKNQVIKILWQGEGVPVLRNGEPLPGEWYRVMTDDGAAGWCFSMNLRIYDERDEKNVSDEAEIQNDPMLVEMLNKQWYPESYAKMIAINRVDLETISPDYGFFPGLKTKVARITMKDTNASFPYSKISKGEANVYNFDGSNLSLQIRSASRISVQFTDSKGMPDVEYFVTLQKPLDTIIAEEKERRNKIITDIAESVKNGTFQSVSYGVLQISSDGQFLWNGFEVLSGKIIPAGAQTTGRVKIRFFVSPKLSSSYDSVLSFYFDGVSESVDFLASRSDKGLQLEYIDKKNITDSVAEKRNKQPIVLFFSK